MDKIRPNREARGRGQGTGNQRPVGRLLENYYHHDGKRNELLYDRELENLPVGKVFLEQHDARIGETVNQQHQGSHPKGVNQLGLVEVVGGKWRGGDENTPENGIREHSYGPRSIEVIIVHFALLDDVLLGANSRYYLEEMNDYQDNGNEPEICRLENAGKYQHTHDTDSALNEPRQQQQKGTGKYTFSEGLQRSISRNFRHTPRTRRPHQASRMTQLAQWMHMLRQHASNQLGNRSRSGHPARVAMGIGDEQDR